MTGTEFEVDVRPKRGPDGADLDGGAVTDYQEDGKAGREDT